MIMNDKKYFSEGEALRLITDCGNELQVFFHLVII